MAKKHEHEDHVNHEAWAIPYGDLVTLLLAFFVVMYATSSVNEGKYKVLSDSLNAAFRGAPRTMEPIAIGDKPAKAKGDDTVAGIKPGQVMKLDADKALDTPTLIESWRTAPYLFDGSAATMRDTLTGHPSPPPKLTDAELNDLCEFVLSL